MSTDENYDAAKRLSDTYSLHRIADVHGNIGKWFAVRLSDGSGDGVLYDSKLDAIRHQMADEKYYAFTQIVPKNMTVQDAAAFLSMHRKVYAKGHRPIDREARGGGVSMIPRMFKTDQYAQLRAMFIGDVAPTNIIRANEG